jgi:hypothetical protein
MKNTARMTLCILTAIGIAVLGIVVGFSLGVAVDKLWDAMYGVDKEHGSVIVFTIFGGGAGLISGIALASAVDEDLRRRS